MRIGLVADIHGNQPALESVLADASVDAWICAGDVVGYYPDVNEVCEILRDLRAWVVRGNHDCYVTGTMEPNRQNRASYKCDWTRSTLSQANLRWLASLPVEINISFGAKRVWVRHASPWDEETYVYPDSVDLLRQIVPPPEDYWILGHTHHPFSRESDGGHLVNPGSIGQPRDYNPAPSYMISDLSASTLEHRRTTYDVAGYQSKLRDLGWPAATIGILSRERQ
jgi:putative phosphoesterase